MSLHEIYDTKNRQISGNTVADGSGDELRVVVDASGFIVVTQQPLSYLVDSVKVRGSYSNANVEQFGFQSRVSVDSAINPLSPGRAYAHTLSFVYGYRPAIGSGVRILSDDNNALIVNQRVGGVEQYGYSQQPAFVNTNQQVVTQKSAVGVEQFGLGAIGGMVNVDQQKATLYEQNGFIIASNLDSTDGVASMNAGIVRGLTVLSRLTGFNGVTWDRLRSSVQKELKADLSGGSILSGSRTVAAAGTAVPLFGDSRPCKKIWIQASNDNTGDVYVGDAGIDNTVGIHLETHQANKSHNILEIEIDNAQKIWVDAENNGDGVTFNYVTWNSKFRVLLLYHKSID